VGIATAFAISPDLASSNFHLFGPMNDLETLSLKTIKMFYSLALPCLAFGVGRLLHLPSAEAVSVRPNARPQK